VKVDIIATDFFEIRFKKLKKKFKTLLDELVDLQTELSVNPTMGTDLGNGLHKIRLASKSKGKGKSGGFRVITYLVVESKTETTIYLITIYDKSEEENITKQELLKLVKSVL